MAVSTKLVQINKLREELKASMPFTREQEEKLWKKFRLEWNYNSNHIEGNTLTYGETQLLLINGKTTGDHEVREFEEMKAHDVAIHMIKDWAADKDRELTEADIRNLNKIILVQPYWKEAITPDGQPTRRQIKVGEYKEFPNSVRLKTGELFHYAPPQETPGLMKELMDWFRNNDIKHPAVLAAELHYRFIRIHPFDDGNGRIARLLVNYVLMQSNYPPIIIKSADKENYLTALQKADAGDINAFYSYIADQLTWSLEISLKAANNEPIEEDDDLDKELHLLRAELKRKEPVGKPATSENIANAIEENIIPLFIMVEEKCEGLKEFFFDYDRIMKYQFIGAGTEYALGAKESTWESMKQNWLNNKVKPNNAKIGRFQYQYVLKGFKQTIEAQSFWVTIDVFFNDYNYSIQIDNRPILIPYGKNLNKVKIQQLIAPSIQTLIKRIKDSANAK